MFRRIAVRTAQVLIVLAVLSAAAIALVWNAAYRAMPQTSGEIRVEGPRQTVTIARDIHGIPTITAANEADAFFALGYVHAQDRLFQMELTRRIGQGRLSELIGSLGVSTDRFMRTLGLYRRVESDLVTAAPDVTAAVDSYTAGVNAWLTNRDRPLPFEFQLLWFSPEPWKPADSLVWQKLMGLQLSGNWDEELENAALINKLGVERAATLWTERRSAQIAELAPLFRALQPERLRAALTAVVQPTLASNIWVVGGERSGTGKPILANDPHLGFQAPSIWYLAAIRTPDWNVTGATVPGVPFHLLGHNGHLAWGFTTTHSDTSDLFIERIGDGDTYLTPDGAKPFTTREETIAVRFGEPVTITVRETRHGPIVSDVIDDGDVQVLPEGDRVLALSSALLAAEDRTSDGIYRMARATDAASFIAALENFQAPQQNVMFADIAGSIGFYAPGRVPIRKAGDGTVPVPGWTGDYDWTGWVPFADLPQEINPADGTLVNANDRIVGDDYPYLITTHWNDGYRAARVEQMMRTDNASLTDHIAMQSDSLSLAAVELKPLLLSLLPETFDPNIRKYLMAWDGRMARDLTEPLLFNLWVENLQSALLADDLGDLASNYGGTRPEVLQRILTTDTDWCDDTRTPALETCAQQVAAALDASRAWIDLHSVNGVAPRWGDFHQAAFQHQLLRGFPLIGGLGTSIIETDGDNFTVNRGAHSSSQSTVPFRHRHGPGFRAVYDLSDLAHSRFALAGGQSGHLPSASFADLLTPWRDGETFTMGANPVRETLILIPATP